MGHPYFVPGILLLLFITTHRISTHPISNSTSIIESDSDSKSKSHSNSSEISVEDSGSKDIGNPNDHKGIRFNAGLNYTDTTYLFLEDFFFELGDKADTDVKIRLNRDTGDALGKVKRAMNLWRNLMKNKFGRHKFKKAESNNYDSGSENSETGGEKLDHGGKGELMKFVYDLLGQRFGHAEGNETEDEKGKREMKLAIMKDWVKYTIGNLDIHSSGDRDSSEEQEDESGKSSDDSSEEGSEQVDETKDGGGVKKNSEDSEGNSLEEGMEDTKYMVDEDKDDIEEENISFDNALKTLIQKHVSVRKKLEKKLRKDTRKLERKYEQDEKEDGRDSGGKSESESESEDASEELGTRLKMEKEDLWQNVDRIRYRKDINNEEGSNGDGKMNQEDGVARIPLRRIGRRYRRDVSGSESESSSEEQTREQAKEAQRLKREQEEESQEQKEEQGKEALQQKEDLGREAFEQLWKKGKQSLKRRFQRIFNLRNEPEREDQIEDIHDEGVHVIGGEKKEQGEQRGQAGMKHTSDNALNKKHREDESGQGFGEEGGRRYKRSHRGNMDTDSDNNNTNVEIYLYSGNSILLWF